MNDIEILRIHGYAFSLSDSESSDSEDETLLPSHTTTRKKFTKKKATCSSDSGHSSSLSDFDDEYFAEQPPAIPISEFKHLIVKIKAKSEQNSNVPRTDLKKGERTKAVIWQKRNESVQEVSINLQDFPPLPTPRTQAWNSGLNSARVTTSLNANGKPDIIIKHRQCDASDTFINLQDFPPLPTPPSKMRRRSSGSKSANIRLPEDLVTEKLQCDARNPKCSNTDSNEIKIEDNKENTKANKLAKVEDEQTIKIKNKTVQTSISRKRDQSLSSDLGSEANSESCKTKQEAQDLLDEWFGSCRGPLGDQNISTDSVTQFPDSNMSEMEPPESNPGLSEVLGIATKPHTKTNRIKIKKETPNLKQKRCRSIAEENSCWPIIPDVPIKQSQNQPKSNNSAKSDTVHCYIKKSQLGNGNRAIQTKIRIASSRRYKPRNSQLFSFKISTSEEFCFYVGVTSAFVVLVLLWLV